MQRKFFQKISFRIIFLFVAVFLHPLSLIPSDFGDWLKKQNPLAWDYEKVSPHVYYKKIFIPEIPLSIHILKVHLDKKFVELELQKAEDGIFGRRTLMEIAKREIEKGKNVIAGVNASFFEEDGRPVGLFVDEGIIYTLSNRRSSLIKTIRDELLISKSNVEIFVGAGREKVKIKELNKENQNWDGVHLFTYVYNKKIKVTKDFVGIVAKIGEKRFSPTENVKGYVSEITRENEIQLKKGEILLVVKKSEKILKNVKVNCPIKFIIRNLYFRDDIEFAVTGAPQIVRKGVNVYKGATEGLTSKFTDVRHPRTGIGITKDGKKLFLIVVDGRQPQLSIGMTLEELAELFIKLGCYNSLNLDGGGSTTMWVKGRVVNSPSDPTGERPISDALLVIENERAEELRKITNSPITKLQINKGRALEIEN